MTEALLDDSILAGNLERVAGERTRLSEGLNELGWIVRPSVTNFVLVDFETDERAAAVAEALLTNGLVPRTFGAGHPLAHCLRITIRSAAENDRLLAAAATITLEEIA